MLGVLVRIEAVDVHVPEVKRRFALSDPMRQRHARTTTGLNADGVEASGHKNTLHFRCRSKNITLISGEAFGAIEEFTDSDLFQRRNSLHRVFQDRREMVKILG